MSQLQHMKVKATTTTQERGVFAAIAAAYSVDRVNERIVPGAFGKTITAWQASDKMIPLHWDHSGNAADIIGWVDPKAMRETDDGLYVEGRLDIKTSDVAKEAWRSMKNNAVSLSFGYLPKARKGKDGVTELFEIDLFEVSIVPAPANPDTRVLSLKNFPEAAPAVEDGTDEEPETAKSTPQDPPDPEDMQPDELNRAVWTLILDR